ncbi:hypothetical protein C8J27_102208 [Rhodobacter aestuarii]|uniref:Uncharacterized protein n=1 Tax=Rhodobacter aestuarii TaxID=453582 RepID=A0A1N7NEF8_9RHOB|nr:hypothetical protein [Rhodobacter aestuarii]PTV96414.1 hypothetical protein C8J27_102208 [Rhodobacter aestuarii]SIS96745.1 hypothetical protein SAMN05421580_107208 [Rhodobacter aestuarii]
MVETDLTRDHKPLEDEAAARRYFAKFERITGLLQSVVREMEAGGSFAPSESAVLVGYAQALAASFRALSLKYLIAGRLTGVVNRHLTIDLHESGFPVFQEILTMANDAAQAQMQLSRMESAEVLKEQMVQRIIARREVPTDLQYALSQRLYLEALGEGGLFWPQMPPAFDHLGVVDGRARLRLHWAVYDSTLNLPVIYILDLEDTGRLPLSQDAGRRARLEAHLLAQSITDLKLLTIARGIDADFDDLHPKRLLRIHLGPMYSHAYTLQTGPIREVLETARAPEGDDWALAWTVEELESARVELEKGWFSATEREVFQLDPLSPAGAERGATRMRRALILPQRPYQALAELNPPGFADVRKFVVGAGDRVIVSQ